MKMRQKTQKRLQGTDTRTHSNMMILNWKPAFPYEIPKVG